MKPENAIEVNNVTKKFRIYHDKGHMLKEKVLHWSRNKYEEHWVLNGISFEIKKGEAVGIIGHNGCGKSTTLKLLTKIMYPDSGTIEMCGRVSSLLELGAGFHPDMSGRENIYINASIFGLSKHEIDRRLNEIIAFSELEDFIDNPVRTYSSGMYMRLAFSVAINVNADILLIDEILAVGDVNFAAKCFNKLMEIKAQGTTIVLVSHSPAQIESICERSIWIHEGLIRAEGNPRNVHRQYLTYMGELRNKHLMQEEPAPEPAPEEEKPENNNAAENQEVPAQAAPEDSYNHTGSGEVRVSKVYFTDKDGKKKAAFQTFEEVVINIEYTVKKAVNEMNLGISIIRNDGVCIYGVSIKDDENNYISAKKNGRVKFVLPENHLLAGKYGINIGIEDSARNSLDYVDQAESFDIYCVDTEVGAFFLDHKWEYEV